MSAVSVVRRVTGCRNRAPIHTAGTRAPLYSMAYCLARCQAPTPACLHGVPNAPYLPPLMSRPRPSHHPTTDLQMRDHLVNSNGAALCMELLRWSEGEPRLAALCFFLAANIGFRSEASRNELYMAGFVPLLVTNMRLCPDKTEVQYFAVSYVQVWCGGGCRSMCTHAGSRTTVRWAAWNGCCRPPYIVSSPERDC